MTNTKASIIIPVNNGERYIRQTINSALAQTYSDFEVIVVDDGSSDNTRNILASYGNRIRYIYQENKGPAAARNTGYRVANGQYLLFLDSDDLIPPEKLARHIDFLETWPQHELAYSAWHFLSDDGSTILGEKRPRKEGHLLVDMLRRSFVMVSPGAVVIKRTCLDRIGLFDESPALIGTEDTDLWLRIAAAGYTFGYIDQPLLQYRVRHDSVSSNTARKIEVRTARLDKFFTVPDLPEVIKNLKAEAYSTIYFEAAADYYRIGDMEQGCHNLQMAIKLCPAKTEDRDWILEWLAAAIAEPQTKHPLKMLNRIFAHLPPEAAFLKSLRRQAVGRYHTAAAFTAYHNQRPQDIRHHIVPALLNDVRLITNRGFIKIVLHALYSWLILTRQGFESL